MYGSVGRAITTGAAMQLGILCTEKGVSTIVLPIFLGIMLSFAAFSIDMGRAFILRHEVQAACDAAAIAGASMFVVEFDETDETYESEIKRIEADLAQYEAHSYFELNYNAKALETNGITTSLSLDFDGDGVSEYLGYGSLKEDLVSYRYGVEAYIPLIIAGPFLGMGTSQTVRVFAEATVK